MPGDDGDFDRELRARRDGGEAQRVAFDLGRALEHVIGHGQSGVGGRAEL